MKSNGLMILLPIIIVYLAIAAYGAVSYSPIWDEGSHNFVLFFAYDAITEHPDLLGDPGAFQDYAIDYNQNYSFYSSIYYHPPLYKLFALAFFLVIGPGLFALRLPTLILGVAGVMLSYLTARELTRDKNVPVLTTLLFAFSHIYMQWSGIGNMDVALSAFVLASFYLFIRHEKTKDPRFLYLSGLLIGLSFLIKASGLSTILIILLYKLASGRARDILTGRYILTCIITALVSLPWVIFYALRPYENLSTIGRFIFQWNFLSLGYWPGVLFNLVYFVTIPGLVLFMTRYKPGKSRFNLLVLLWAGVYLFTFIFIYDYLNGFPRLVLPALFPVMYMISLALARLKRRHLCLFLAAFVIQSAFFSAAYMYSPPTESAVDHFLESSDPDTGVIITNANQQLYLMLKDTGREHFSLWFTGDIDGTVRDLEENKGYPGNATLPVTHMIVDSQLVRDTGFLNDSRIVLEEEFAWSHAFEDVKLMYDSPGTTDSISVYRISWD